MLSLPRQVLAVDVLDEYNLYLRLWIVYLRRSGVLERRLRGWMEGPIRVELWEQIKKRR